MDILGTIEAMEFAGYPAESILATVRGQLKAERRGYWDSHEAAVEADRYAREVEERRRLARLVAAGLDGFDLEAA